MYFIERIAMLRNKYLCPDGGDLAGWRITCRALLGARALLSLQWTRHIAFPSGGTTFVQATGTFSLNIYVDRLNNVLSAIKDLIELLKINCYWCNPSLSYVYNLCLYSKELSTLLLRLVFDVEC